MAAELKEFRVQSDEEIYRRFDEDYFQLQKTFFWPKEKYAIQSLEKIGDTHANCMEVTQVNLKNQRGTMKILFKPRDLSIDTAYAKFIEWCNSITGFGIKTVKRVVRINYGWEEFVAHQSCNSEFQVKNFYHRYGYLLGIMILLHGTDITRCNLIASKDHPVIIDVEGLFGVRGEGSPVIKTGMLPKIGYSNECGQFIDKSALLGVGEEKRNCVFLNKNRIDPRNYIKEIIYGFSKIYKKILSQRLFLLSKDSVLNYFNNCEVRVILRNTSDYYRCLKSGAALIPINKLAGISKLSTQDKSNLYEHEIACLKNGFIPRFTAKTDDLEIYDSYQLPLKIKLEQSGIKRVKNFLRNAMSLADLANHIELIRYKIQLT